MKRLETLSAIVILLASTAMGRADWQYARDYSTTVNDGTGGWQSGYLTGAEGTFHAFNTPDVAWTDTLVGWHDGVTGWDELGNSAKTISSSDLDSVWGTYYEAGQVAVMSGNGAWVAVRWIAPTAGYYAVSANWTNQRKDGTDVTVTMRDTAATIDWLPNSTGTLTEFAGTDGSVAAGKFSYNNTLYLTAGQNIDFVVEKTIYGVYQVAGLNATITAVPEPAMLVLVTSGLLGLMAYAWRKR